MGLEQTVTGCVAHVEIEGDLTIATAARLKDELCSALATGQDICVSLEHVGTLDITAIQLLWAASHEAQTAHRRLFFAKPVPEQILSVLREAGIPFPSLLEAEG